jgi:hypothetical protein
MSNWMVCYFAIIITLLITCKQGQQLMKKIKERIEGTKLHVHGR